MSRVDPNRLAWLNGIADRVPRLLDAIRKGSCAAEFLLGERRINGRRVRLTLRAQVIEGAPLPDDGNPLPELPRLNPAREDDPVRRDNLVGSDGVPRRA